MTASVSILRKIAYRDFPTGKPMNTVKKILTIYGLLFSLSLAGADIWDDRIVNLRGRWKFTIGDNLDWAKPEYDDSNWEEIYVPSSWENEGFHGYDGYAWYRVGFKLSSDADLSSLSIELGYIDDVDEVYINGVLIGFTGGFPPDFYTAYTSYRKYPIPEEVLNKNGVNIIAVRIYDTVHEGGILKGDIGIYERRTRSANAMMLSGIWKIQEGDDMQWKNADFDDSNWQKIIVPGFWKSLKKKFAEEPKYAWYRKEFTLPESLKNEKELVLVLGRIDDFDKTYLNGQLIGFTNDGQPFGRSGSYGKLRVYVLLDSYLNKNAKNVISVRVEDMGGNAGIYEGPIGIVPMSEYRKFVSDKH